VPFVALFVAVIAFIGGPVAWVPVLAIPLVLLLGLLLQLPLDRVVRRTFRESAQKHAILVEALGGLETIKGLAAEGRAQRAYEDMVGLTAQSSLQARLLAALAVNFSSTLQSLVTIAVVVIGVMLINAGELTVGALVACTMLSSRAMAPLAQIASLLTRYNHSMASLEALNRIMALPIERPDGKRFLHRPQIEGGIEFRDVDFRYPEQEIQALAGVSFAVAPGERVGIIGRIGSGKSTVVRLILGLYEPTEGAVLVDGTDLRQIDPADLRRGVGLVPQDVYLFYGTVRDNIAYGAPYADDEAILRAAHLAGVDEFTSQHPRGLDMLVGERGEGLSGGQRQAIAVARALLLDPPIIVMDEPTSAMDNATEQRFLRRMAEARGGRTVVVVTHRSSMLALVERLIVLDAGRVVADGPKDQVLRSLSQGKLRAAGTEG
jgi:ATP-binding cassette subfamily C protein LapB